MAVVYFFSGLAKLNNEWLHGRPMDAYLSRKMDFPFIGSLFDEQLMAYLFSCAALFFDLFIVAALLWRPTRVPAVLVAVSFHVLNSLLFGIEVFPWLAICATLLFLSPSWPRVFSNASAPSSPPVVAGGSALSEAPLTQKQQIVGVILVAYVLLQLLLPLRHYLYPGPVEWNSEGHYYAWRMLISDNTGNVEFFITDKATGARCEVLPSRYVESFQEVRMPTRPDMIIQFAHYIRDYYADRDQDVEVYARSRFRHNGGEERPLIDPTIDLAAQKRSAKSTWMAEPDGPPVPERERIPACEDEARLDRIGPPLA
jgi:hypothetical protein